MFLALARYYDSHLERSDRLRRSGANPKETLEDGVFEFEDSPPTEGSPERFETDDPDYSYSQAESGVERGANGFGWSDTLAR